MGWWRVWRASAAFVACAAAGLAMWVYALPLFGDAEPWDGNVALYALATLVAGVLGGLLSRSLWIPPVGLYAGQFAYCIAGYFHHSGGGANFFIPLGAIFLASYCLPALIGAGIGVIVLRGRVRPA